MERNEHSVLKVENLSVSYGQIQAVRSISLEVRHGEMVSLVGSNGAGKSTLLNAILGMHRAHTGTVTYNGCDITHMSTDRIIARGIAVVPEGRGVLAQMTVLENLQLGAYHVRGSIAKNLENVLLRFPILRKRQGQIAGTLSGGEQQILAIGRALMSTPALLILDEPSLALAPIMVDEVFRILAGLKTEGMTILLSEQNARKALQYSDRGYVLDLGTVSLEGTSEELCDNNQGVCAAYLGEG